MLQTPLILGQRDVSAIAPALPQVMDLDGPFLDGILPVYSVIFASDLDQDGDLDLLAASEREDTVYWFEKLNGLGTYGPARLVLENIGRPRGLSASDLDGDGMADVMVGSFSEDRVVWVKNLGGGTFGSPKTILDGAISVEAVVVADLNGDGIPDVLVASGEDREVRWCRGAGLGQFDAAATVYNRASSGPRVGNWPRSLSVADLNGDGTLDVAVVSMFDSFVSWFSNVNGDGTLWSTQVVQEIPPSCRSILASDMNGDGSPDLMVSSGRGMYLYTNLGNGSFGQPAILDPSRQYYGFAAIDIDGDGLKDMVAASIFSDAVYWFRNRGESVFDESVTLAEGANFVDAVFALNETHWSGEYSTRVFFGYRGGFAAVHLVGSSAAEGSGTMCCFPRTLSYPAVLGTAV